MADAWRDVVADGFRRGQDLSVVGPGDVEVHLEHADRLAEALEPPVLAMDIGSGAGIPGLVLAGTWPGSTWTLLDAAKRRTNLLQETVSSLGWGERVHVLHERAEIAGRDPGHRARYDLVTARLFGPPAVTAECGAPFLSIGGVLAVTEPPGGVDRWDDEALAALGLERLEPMPGLQRFRAVHAPEERFPRKPGVPAKRPLF